MASHFLDGPVPKKLTSDEIALANEDYEKSELFKYNNLRRAMALRRLLSLSSVSNPNRVTPEHIEQTVNDIINFGKSR